MLKKNKILFIASHRPNRSPGQRFRFEQYFGYLEANGFECDFSYIFSEDYDRIIYAHGKYLSKFLVFLNSFIHRLKDVLKAKQYNIVFIQREAFMTGTVFFEKLFKKSGAKLVFDFDDTIWVSDSSPINNSLSWLKKPKKTSKIIEFCDLIFAGNSYLARYAEQFNKNVVIVPTTIDTDEYQKKDALACDSITIGWSGSFSTVKYFKLAEPVLLRLKDKYGERVKFSLIGDENYTNLYLDLKGIKWRKETEVTDLSKFDIGIMPLPNDEWSKGKCGLKGLQYMALEIPTIMSPVGVNSEIINDGVNGFLADDENEWFQKLSRLIESRELRETLGKKGRKTVVDNYSVESQKDNYVNLLLSVL
ncbi:MAG: glycosyltransferase family 4 protein [Candidatus Electrothrix communis]|nr:MAG: glycosyltransferase family 4 protein [Candidatus Electrothrix communis]